MVQKGPDPSSQLLVGEWVLAVMSRRWFHQASPFCTMWYTWLRIQCAHIQSSYPHIQGTHKGPLSWSFSPAPTFPWLFCAPDATVRSASWGLSGPLATNWVQLWETKGGEREVKAFSPPCPNATRLDSDRGWIFSGYCSIQDPPPGSSPHCL